jgi:hypothetical protein
MCVHACVCMHACGRLSAPAPQELVLNMPEAMWGTALQRQENAAVDGRADNMAK